MRKRVPRDPFQGVLALLNGIGSVCLIGLMVLIIGDVTGRVALDHPVPGVPEIVKLSIVGIVWLQFAYTLRTDRHLRTTLVFDLLPAAWKRVVYALNCAAGFAVFGLIIWYSQDNVVDTYRWQTFEGEDPVRIPVWPVWTLVVLGAGLTGIEYLIQLSKALFFGRLPGHPTAPEDGRRARSD